jgi:hypothetical protein
MSYDTSTLLVFGFKLSDTEAELIEEKYSDDIYSKIHGCFLHLYGNMVSGNTAYLLGACNSCQWGPDASSKAEIVNFADADKVQWVSQLFEICYQAGVKVEGKHPDWLLVSTYG